MNEVRTQWRRWLSGGVRHVSRKIDAQFTRATCDRFRRSLAVFMGCMILVVGLGSGCNDFLDVDSEDQLSRDELFSSLRGADAAVVGLYRQLTDLYDYRYPIYADLPGHTVAPNTDLPAGNALISTQRGLLQLRERNVTPVLENTGFAAFYDDAYTLLFQAADVLDGLALVQDARPEQLASLEAEARTIRALVHFELVRVFAQAPGFAANATHPGVVIIDQLPSIFDQPARATVAEVYAFIRNELALASTGIDDRLTERSGAALWVNSATIQGLAARVAAYQSDWPVVIESATAAIEAAGVDLTPAADYLAQWRTGSLDEVLWEVDLQQRLVDLDAGDVFNTTATLIGSRNPRPVLGVAAGLVDSLGPGDLRRGLYSANEAGTVLCGKWPLDTGALVNPILLRLSELYLLRAEAYAESGQLNLALEDFLSIRQRAVSRTAVPDLDVVSLRAAIREERRLELALENHHFFDLGRWGVEVPGVGLGYPDDRFVLPLPEEALLRNPSLRQNPGY